MVHHAILFVDGKRQGRKLEERARREKDPADTGPGYTLPLSMAFLPGFLPQSGMGGWAPGQIIRHLPEGDAQHRVEQQRHQHQGDDRAPVPEDLTDFLAGQPGQAP